MWKETSKDIGEVKVGDKQTITFQYDVSEGETMQMAKLQTGQWDIESSCQCSGGTWAELNRVITIYFTPQPVPLHIAKIGVDYYMTTKMINGKMIVNGVLTPFTLTFTAKVVS